MFDFKSDFLVIIRQYFFILVLNSVQNTTIDKDVSFSLITLLIHLIYAFSKGNVV